MTLIGSSHGATNGNSLTVVPVAGTQVGDRVVGAFICDHNINLTVPAAWTVLDRRDVVVSNLDQGNLIVERTCTGTADDTLTLVSSGVEIAGGVVTFRDMTTVTDAIATNNGGPASAAITMPAVSAVPSLGGGYIMYVATAGSNSGHFVTLGDDTGDFQFRRATTYFDIAVGVLAAPDQSVEPIKTATTTSASSCWAGYSVVVGGKNVTMAGALKDQRRSFWRTAPGQGQSN